MSNVHGTCCLPEDGGVITASAQTELTTEGLLAVAQLAAEKFPGAKLVKNMIGNLAVVDDGWYKGFIDLRAGELADFKARDGIQPLESGGPQFKMFHSSNEWCLVHEIHQNDPDHDYAQGVCEGHHRPATETEEFEFQRTLAVKFLEYDAAVDADDDLDDLDKLW
jgi:hypothetical protein